MAITISTSISASVPPMTTAVRSFEDKSRSSMGTHATTLPLAERHTAGTREGSLGELTRPKRGPVSGGGPPHQRAGRDVCANPQDARGARRARDRSRGGDDQPGIARAHG